MSERPSSSSAPRQASRHAPRVGVVLCGAGYLDGSEIHEAVVAMLCLEEAGATLDCLALAKPQAAVYDHVTGQAAAGTRSQLEESARLARGKVRDLAGARADELDALVIPGGYGAARNLCDFAARGAEATIDPDVARFRRAMHEARKPIGALCIAPAVVALALGKVRPVLTIGADADVAAALTSLGAEHRSCAVDDIVVDETNRLVSTPAYMLGESVRDVHAGIRKLAQAVVARTGLHGRP